MRTKILKFDHTKSEIVKHYQLAPLGVFNKDIYGSNSSFPIATIEIFKTTTQKKQQKIHYHHIYQNYPTKYTQ